MVVRYCAMMHICDLQGENVQAMRLLRRGCSTLPLDMHGMLTREGTQMRVSDGQKQALEQVIYLLPYL